MIAIDIGNSRIKVYSQDKYSYYHYAEDWNYFIKQDLLNYQNPDKIIVYSSVNPPVNKVLFDIISKLDVSYKIINALDIMPYQTKLNFNLVEGMGIDRILGIYGGLNYCKPPLITVDCGTAITVNAVNKVNECIGGAIFSGPFNHLYVLEMETAGIEGVMLLYESQASGRNTSKAVSSGIFLCTVGGIKEIITRISKQEFNNIIPNVIITGGSFKMLIHAFEEIDIKLIYKEHLVLEGLQSLYEETKSFINLEKA